jgi:polyphosphate kinase 2 (PPK2 family)
MAMGIDLGQFEAGTAYGGDANADGAALQARLTQAQMALIAHEKSAVIVLEAWEGVSRSIAIGALTSAWDPRRFRAWEGVSQDETRPLLASFWQRLPAPGEITLFDSSWYAAILDARITERMERKRIYRAYDEINEFEAQQREYGVILIKIFLHVDGHEQRARHAAMLDDPWQAGRVSGEQMALADDREASLLALADQFAETDTRWAPWTVIDANNPETMQITVMEAVASQLERALPKEPPHRAGFMLQDS